MKKFPRKEFVRGRDSIELSPGEMLATIRKLQELTQKDLSKLTGISQSNLSAMERGNQQIGRERALVLADALKVHPAVIMFPNYRVANAA